MTDPRKPGREVFAVARELAKAANAEAVRIMGDDATPWEALTQERRSRAIRALLPTAQLAVDTITATRILRLVEHPSLALVRDQFDKADTKGYTRAHDREHGPERLLAASQAYTVWATVHLNYPDTDDQGDTYGWPFSNGWDPETPAAALIKAAHLLLSAADVIAAETQVAP